MGLWEERLARNEAVFRAVNERVEDLSESGVDDPIAFVCECGHADCTQEVLLTRGEYEALRSSPVTFAVAHGHEIPAIETVVSRTERYAVVEKDPGQRGVARERDPRSA